MHSANRNEPMKQLSASNWIFPGCDVRIIKVSDTQFKVEDGKGVEHAASFEEAKELAADIIECLGD